MLRDCIIDSSDDKRVILCITGSIAAYKSIELAKLLINKGFEIEIVLSKSAPKFISINTLKGLFPNKIHAHDKEFSNNDKMMHIELAKKAQLILIAPATANTIAKLSNGFADCLLSSICLVTRAPIVLVPAMNQFMWLNELVQNNVKKLSKYGYKFVGPCEGHQACGDFGYGRMAKPINVVEYVEGLFIPKLFSGKKIVITAGPTVEMIDPVRFISNCSSGKMGYAMAKFAQYMGADVTLISGPTSLQVPQNVQFISIQSADEMLKASLVESENADIFIGNAAIADYKPLTYSNHKLKKDEQTNEIRLIQNIDIISTIRSTFKELFCVGFAAETSNIHQNGYQKLQSKHLDLIAINDVSNGKVFGQDYNEIYVINSSGENWFIERNKKENVAVRLLEIIANLVNKKNSTVTLSQIEDLG